MSPNVTPEDKVSLLEGVGQQTDNKLLASEALIALGNEYARRAVVMDRMSDPARWQELMDTASSYYEKAMAQHPDRPLAQAESRLGLASLAEDMGDLDAAKEHYEAVLALKGLDGYPVVKQAEDGLGNLDWLAEPVRMASTAPAEPETQPASQPATAPATMPADADAPADGPVEADVPAEAAE
jgi:tetratricopeptide (TPR) repeat protein